MGNSNHQSVRSGSKPLSLKTQNPATRVLALSNKLNTMSIKILKNTLKSPSDFRKHVEDLLPTGYPWSSGIARYFKCNQEDLYRQYRECMTGQSIGVQTASSMKVVEDQAIKDMFQASILCRYEVVQDETTEETRKKYKELVAEISVYLTMVNRIRRMLQPETNHDKQNPMFVSNQMEEDLTLGYGISQKVFCLAVELWTLSYKQIYNTVNTDLKQRKYFMPVNEMTIIRNRKAGRYLYEFGKRQANMGLKQKYLKKFYTNIDMSCQNDQDSHEMTSQQVSSKQPLNGSYETFSGEDRVTSCILQHLSNSNLYPQLAVLAELKNFESQKIKSLLDRVSNVSFQQV